MKAVLATVVVSVLAVAPAAASDVAYALRGHDRAAPAQASAATATATPASEAAPARKVRVVLASPYGN